MFWEKGNVWWNFMDFKLSRYKFYVAVDVRVGFLLTDKNFICNENEIKSRHPFDDNSLMN